MSDTPKKFPIPQIERAIHESLNPKGMSTHSGKVTLDVSWVQRLLILADHMSELERELAEAQAEIVRLKKRRDECSNGWDGALATVQRLERELAEARAELAETKKELNDKSKFCYAVEQALDGFKGDYVEIIKELRTDAATYRWHRFDYDTVTYPLSAIMDECNHDFIERETACADGFCPICATAKIVRLKGEAQYGATFIQRAIDAERELAEAKAQRDKAIAFLHVYRNDTPLGHQPHMLAHEVDQFLKECGK